jgi:hypothetical protein
MRRISLQLFPWVSGILSLACMWLGVSAAGHGHENSYSITMLCGAALFGTSGLAVHFNWKAAPLLCFVAGVPLCLYALSVLLWGWEYLGGAALAVPLALLCGSTGVMALALSGKRPPREAT